MHFIRNLCFFFLISHCAYTSQSWISIDLDVHDIYRKFKIQDSIPIADKSYLSIIPANVIICKQNRTPPKFKWTYPLDFNFLSQDFKLMSNDPIPSKNELKFWKYIIVVEDILLDQEEIGTFSFEVHNAKSNKNSYIYVTSFFLYKPFQHQGYFLILLPTLIERIKNTFPFVKSIECIVVSQNPKMAWMLKELGEFELSQDSLLILNELNLTPEIYFSDSTQVDKLCMIKRFDKQESQ